MTTALVALAVSILASAVMAGINRALWLKQLKVWAVWLPNGVNEPDSLEGLYISYRKAWIAADDDKYSLEKPKIEEIKVD